MKRTPLLALCCILLAALLLAGCGRQSFDGEWELEGINGQFSATVKNFDDEYLLASQEFLQETHFAATVDVTALEAGASPFQLVLVLPGNEYLVLYDSDRDGAPYGSEQQLVAPTGLAELKFVGTCKRVDITFTLTEYDPYG